MSAVAPTDLAGLIACLDNADSPIQEKIDAISKIKDTIEPVAVSRVTCVFILSYFVVHGNHTFLAGKF